MARIGKGTAAALVAAAGLVALIARNQAPRSAVPPGVERIVRRHVSPTDFDGFADAVREHVAAGRPITRAALGALASIWLDPSAVTSIKRDLKAAGY